MTTQGEPSFSTYDRALLASTVDVARNALWNYVTLIVWLRWLRRMRVVGSILPIVFGGLGSWHILSTNSGPSLVAAVFSLLAGLLPLLYYAAGVDEQIASAERIAGGYRRIEAKLRALVFGYGMLSSAERRQTYDMTFAEYLELKSIAHTAPRLAFAEAERLIANKDYVPITIADAQGGDQAAVAPQGA